jgi:guanosine-3',5'-bis(diphosphate) 3'-pyrophosphohydrolase
MNHRELLSEIIAFATQRHYGQFDKGGNPYILHPLKVMYFLKTDDEELQCIAVGHDLIEDTSTSYADLKEIGMTLRIIEGIRHLTNVPGETYEDKIERICSNKDAMLVKLCDLRHNSDIRRLKGVTEKDLKRIERYQKMYTEIKNRLQTIK